MASRYSIYDDIHQFQLYRQLYCTQQQPRQIVHSYVSKLQNLRDQLASCDPAWPNTEVAKVYADLCDSQCVWHMLMTLRDEFEPIRSSLIHVSPFLTLDTVIKDLIS